MSNEWSKQKQNREQEANERRGQIDMLQRAYVATAISVRDCVRSENVGGICCSGWLVGPDGAYRCDCWKRHMEAWKELKDAGREYRKAAGEDYYELFPEVSYQPAGIVDAWSTAEIAEFRKRFCVAVGIKNEYPTDEEVDGKRQEAMVAAHQESEDFLW